MYRRLVTCRIGASVRTGICNTRFSTQRCGANALQRLALSSLASKPPSSAEFVLTDMRELGKQGGWESALQKLIKARSSGLPLTTFACNQTMAVLYDSGRWSEVLVLMKSMKELRKVEPDAESYTLALLACKEMQLFTAATDFMEEAALSQVAVPVSLHAELVRGFDNYALGKRTPMPSRKTESFVTAVMMSKSIAQGRMDLLPDLLSLLKRNTEAGMKSAGAAKELALMHRRHAYEMCLEAMSNRKNTPPNFKLSDIFSQMQKATGEAVPEAVYGPIIYHLFDVKQGAEAVACLKAVAGKDDIAKLDHACRVAVKAVPNQTSVNLNSIRSCIRRSGDHDLLNSLKELSAAKRAQNQPTSTSPGVETIGTHSTVPATTGADEGAVSAREKQTDGQLPRTPAVNIRGFAHDLSAREQAGDYAGVLQKYKELLTFACKNSDTSALLTFDEFSRLLNRAGVAPYKAAIKLKQPKLLSRLVTETHATAARLDSTRSSHKADGFYTSVTTEITRGVISLLCAEEKRSDELKSFVSTVREVWGLDMEAARAVARSAWSKEAPTAVLESLREMFLSKENRSPSEELYKFVISTIQWNKQSALDVIRSMQEDGFNPSITMFHKELQFCEDNGKGAAALETYKALACMQKTVGPVYVKQVFNALLKKGSEGGGVPVLMENLKYLLETSMPKASEVSGVYGYSLGHLGARLTARGVTKADIERAANPSPVILTLLFQNPTFNVKHQNLVIAAVENNDKDAVFKLLQPVLRGNQPVRNAVPDITIPWALKESGNVLAELDWRVAEDGVEQGKWVDDAKERQKIRGKLAQTLQEVLLSGRVEDLLSGLQEVCDFHIANPDVFSLEALFASYETVLKHLQKDYRGVEAADVFFHLRDFLASAHEGVTVPDRHVNFAVVAGRPRKADAFTGGGTEDPKLTHEAVIRVIESVAKSDPPMVGITVGSVCIDVLLRKAGASDDVRWDLVQDLCRGLLKNDDGNALLAVYKSVLTAASKDGKGEESVNLLRDLRIARPGLHIPSQLFGMARQACHMSKLSETDRTRDREALLSLWKHAHSAGYTDRPPFDHNTWRKDGRRSPPTAYRQHKSHSAQSSPKSSPEESRQSPKSSPEESPDAIRNMAPSETTELEVSVETPAAAPVHANKKDKKQSPKAASHTAVLSALRDERAKFKETPAEGEEAKALIDHHVAAMDDFVARRKFTFACKMGREMHADRKSLPVQEPIFPPSTQQTYINAVLSARVDSERDKWFELKAVSVWLELAEDKLATPMSTQDLHTMLQTCVQRNKSHQIPSMLYRALRAQIAVNVDQQCIDILNTMQDSDFIGLATQGVDESKALERLIKFHRNGLTVPEQLAKYVKIWKSAKKEDATPQEKEESRIHEHPLTSGNLLSYRQNIIRLLNASNFAAVPKAMRLMSAPDIIEKAGEDEFYTHTNIVLRRLVGNACHTKENGAAVANILFKVGRNWREAIKRWQISHPDECCGLSDALNEAVGKGSKAILEEHFIEQKKSIRTGRTKPKKKEEDGLPPPPQTEASLQPAEEHISVKQDT